MSKASKKRFVTKQMDLEMVLPGENDTVAQVLGSRGNNLHDVKDATGERYLASMPPKFRRTVWVRRGQFVLLQPIEEGEKVKAEITHVLDTDNVLYIRERGTWPEAFEADAKALSREAKRTDEAGAEEDYDMFPPSGSEDEEEGDQIEEDVDDEEHVDVESDEKEDAGSAH